MSDSSGGRSNICEHRAELTEGNSLGHRPLHLDRPMKKLRESLQGFGRPPAAEVKYLDVPPTALKLNCFLLLLFFYP